MKKDDNSGFNIEEYLSNGVENIVKNALKASFSNPQQSIYMGKYAIFATKARKLRQASEKAGEHIPPFLIASIASNCNLHCAGCYSRANNACEDKVAEDLLTENDWARIFEEAKEMGIGFILLAGGEPLLRPEVIEKALEVPEIIFPIFTNGTLVGEKYQPLFKKYRNLIPILSIEGDRETTDGRRGLGVYDQVANTMEELTDSGIFFGASITVTKENIEEVTDIPFLKALEEKGCRTVIYVEYVPVTLETKELALEDEQRNYMAERLLAIREQLTNMLFVSFPGDEKTSGGCLAAGRGFFHINPKGGAEPCPFSPYSDISLKTATLREALHSKLFQNLKNESVLMEDHAGGCVLFERQMEVERCLGLENN